MQTPEVVEVNDETPLFNEGEWIGRGPKYPTGKGDHRDGIFFFENLILGNQWGCHTLHSDRNCTR